MNYGERYEFMVCMGYMRNVNGMKIVCLLVVVMNSPLLRIRWTEVACVQSI